MNCCFRAKHHSQVTILAGQTAEYPCELTVHKPGPFESEMVLFLEDNGIREVTLTVRGVGVAAGGKTDAPPASP